MDFSAFSDDDLTSILMAHGIQDIEYLSRSEKEMLVRSFVQSTDEEHSHNDDIAMIADQSSLNVTVQDIVDPSNTSIGITSSEVANPVTTNIASDCNVATDSSNHPMEEEETLTDEQNVQISQFCEMTGADPTYAKTVLQATAWNVETAVGLYLEGISTGLSRTNSYQVQPPHPPISMRTVGGGFSEFSIPRALDPADWQRVMDMRRYIPDGHHPMEEDDDDENSPVNHTMYDEEGIRRPDPVKVQRLISRGFSTERSLGRAEDPTIEWLFPPPRHLSSQESFESILAQGKEERRWILVNIQSHDEFPSHLLNRDTWTNDSIESVLRTTFLFWQRGHTTQDGRDFMRLYHIAANQLPRISIIDPRTGASVWHFTGFIEPAELVVKLTDFADQHTLESHQPPPPAHQELPPAPDVNEKSSDNALRIEQPHEEKAPEKSVDFGPVPSVPDDTDPNAVKISMRLANGKSLTRKYNKTDSVRVLFAVACEVDPNNTTKPFDLISRYPPLNLLSCLGKTIDECQIAGGNLLHRWL